MRCFVFDGIQFKFCENIKRRRTVWLCNKRGRLPTKTLHMRKTLRLSHRNKFAVQIFSKALYKNEVMCLRTANVAHIHLFEHIRLTMRDSKQFSSHIIFRTKDTRRDKWWGKKCTKRTAQKRLNFIYISSTRVISSSLLGYLSWLWNAHLDRSSCFYTWHCFCIDKSAFKMRTDLYPLRFNLLHLKSTLCVELDRSVTENSLADVR